MRFPNSVPTSSILQNVVPKLTKILIKGFLKQVIFSQIRIFSPQNEQFFSNKKHTNFEENNRFFNIFSGLFAVKDYKSVISITQSSSFNPKFEGPKQM